MSIDISSLAIEVKSVGLKESYEGLDKVAASSKKAEERVDSLKTSVDKLSNSSERSVTRINSLTESLSKIPAGSISVGVTATAKAFTEIDSSTKTATNSVQKYISKLQQQADTYGMTAKELSVYNASVLKATDNQAIQIQSIVAITEAKKREAQSIKDVAAENKKAAQAAKDDAASVLAGVRSKEMATKSLQDYIAKMQLQADYLGKSKAEIFANNAALRGASEHQIEAARAAGALIDAHKNLPKQVDNGTKSLQIHTSAMKDLHAAARGLAGSLGALWTTYGSAIPLAMGLAVGASLKGIVSVGKDVENTLEGIRVKGGESLESVAAMRDVVISLGQGVYGPKQVAGALETLILAGLNAEQAMKGVGAALNLATVGGTSIEKAAYTLVQVGTSLGYTAEGFGRVGDVIAKTAAVSMSSVESISEAFKSGSAIAKLYGVSLVDQGAAYAALSNLGIQGSAAGTSLKNFYKELQGESKKVTQTLADIGLSSVKLKDSAGNFLPMMEMVAKLAEGINGLGKAEQQTALSRLGNERGIKTLVELVSLYNEKVGESTTKLAELRTAIDESYGYAAIGAASMSLTVDSQFKSVKNTLETSFVKAFQDIQSQLLLVATSLKATFSSPEFISGISAVATALANLAVWVAQNIPLIITLTEAFVAFKVVGAIAGTLMSIGEGLIVLRTLFPAVTFTLAAFRAGLVATMITMGPIGWAILGITAALAAYYALKENKGTDPKQEEAANYVDNFTAALDREYQITLDQINGMKNLKTATEDYAVSLTKVQIRAPVTAKIAQIAGMEKNLSPSDMQNYSDVSTGKYETFTTPLGGTYKGNAIKPTDSVRAILEEKKSLLDLESKALDKENEVDNKLSRTRGASYAQARIEEARMADEKAKALAGAGKLTPKTPKELDKAVTDEIASLYRLEAAYKSKTETYIASTESELRQASHVEAAKVQASIESGKYAGMSSKLVAELQEQAAATDLAKFYNDQAKATEELSHKTSQRLATESAAYNDALNGSIRAVGAIEAEVAAKIKYNEISGETASKILAEARAADVKNEAFLRLVKFNKGTEQAFSNARKYVDEAASINKYGTEVKQTARQLAEFEIAQLKGEAALNSYAVAARLAAASLEDLGKSLKQLEVSNAQIQKDNDKLEGEILGTLMYTESQKIEAKRKTAMKAIEFDMATAESAANAARVEQEALDVAISNRIAYGNLTSEEIAKEMESYNELKAKIEGTTEVLTKARAAYASNMAGLSKSAELANFMDTWKKVESVSQQVFDAIYEGGSDTFIKLEQVLKKTLLQLLYDMTVKQWIFNITASVTGSSISSNGVVSGGSGVSGMLSSANSIYSAITGGFEKLGASVTKEFTSFATSDMGASMGLSATTESVAMGPPTAEGVYPMQSANVMTESSKSMAASAGQIASTLAAAYVGNKIGGAIANGHQVFSGTNLSDVGATIGSLTGNPMIAAAAAVIGGAIDRVFGNGPTQVVASGIRGSFSAERGASVSSYTSTHADGGLFSSDDDQTHMASVSQEFNTYLNNALVATASATKAYAKAIGLSADAVDGYAQEIDISLMGLDAAGQQAAITSALSSFGDGLAQTIIGSFESVTTKVKHTMLGWEYAPETSVVSQVWRPDKTVAKEGETASQTLTRLATTLVTVNGVFSTMNKTLLTTSVTGAVAASALIDAMGGVDKFTETSNTFYQTYYSSEERRAKTTQQVTEAMHDLGLSMPTSIKGFRELVLAQDVNTASGREMYASLMGLSSAFASTVDSIDSIESAWKSAVDSVVSEVARIRGLSTIGTGASYAQAMSNFATATAQARAGDLAAAKSLPALSQALLTLAETNTVSMSALRAVQGSTASSLETTATMVVGSQGLTLPSFDVGTNYVPKDMIAQIHEGEAIVPKAYNPDSQGGGVGSREELADEIRKLREEMKAVALASIPAAQETAKILRKFDYNGLPPERSA